MELSFIFLLSLSGPGRHGLKVICSLILIMVKSIGYLVFQYSLISGKLTPALKKRVLIAGGLLGFQGLLGWYDSRKSDLELQNPTSKVHG